MKKVLAVTAALVSAFLLSGCGAVQSGTVVAKDHKPAYSYEEQQCANYITVPGYDNVYNYETGTYEYKMVPKSQCNRWEPVTRHVPDKYSVVVQHENSSTSTLEISKEVFENTNVGYYYDAETKTIAAR